MKKLLTLLFLVGIPIAAGAQKMSFADLYEKYSDKTGFTTVEISGELIKMFGSGSVEVNGDKSISEMLDGIRFIRIVVADKATETFREDVKKVSSDKEYKLMTSVNKGGAAKLTFYYKDKKEKDEKAPQSEFLMVMIGEKENLALNITGDLDIKNITKLSGLNIGGLDMLGQAEDKEEK